MFAERIGGDILEITGAFAVFAIFAGLFQIFVAKIVDVSYEKEFVLAAGYFITALGELGYIWVSSPLHLFVVQAVLGIALGLVNPSLDFLYSIHLDSGRGGFEWGIYEGVVLIAQGIGAILGGGIVTMTGGFSVLFIAMAALSFISGIIILVMPRSLL